jgi:hypothetical protein
MSFNTGRTQLHAAMKDLSRLWDDVRAGWNDPVSRKFEEEYYVPLEKLVQDTVREIDQLQGVLTRLRQECS